MVDCWFPKKLYLRNSAAAVLQKRLKKFNLLQPGFVIVFEIKLIIVIMVITIIINTTTHPV